MRLTARLAVTKGLAVWFSASIAAEAPAPVTKDAAPDPFDRRPLQKLVARAAQGASPESARAADLRAIIVTRTRSLVNLGGTVIEVGESHEGYRLVSVQETQATFVKDGTQFVLALGRSIPR